MKLHTNLIALAAAATLASAPALAQQGAGQGQQGQQGMPNQQQQGTPAQQSMPQYQQQQQQQDFSEQDLERFNEARVAVEEIRNEYAGKLEGVQDAGEARELQAEASEKMTEEVRDTGLEVQTYNAIAMAVRTDPELRQKVLGEQDS